MKHFTWSNLIHIVAPIFAVVFFAGIVQSTVNANSKNAQVQDQRLRVVEQDIAEIKSDYKHILRVLKRLEEKIDKK